VVIEMIYAFVAKLAMHRFYSDLDVADPALFRWSLRIKERSSPPAAILTVSSFTSIAQEAGIRWIRFHGRVGKSGRGERQAAEDYRAWNRSRQWKQGGHHEEEFHDQDR